MFLTSLNMFLLNMQFLFEEVSQLWSQKYVGREFQSFWQPEFLRYKNVQYSNFLRLYYFILLNKDMALYHHKENKERHYSRHYAYNENFSVSKPFSTRMVSRGNQLLVEKPLKWLTRDIWVHLVCAQSVKWVSMRLCPDLTIPCWFACP